MTGSKLATYGKRLLNPFSMSFLILAFYSFGGFSSFAQATEPKQPPRGGDGFRSNNQQQQVQGQDQFQEQNQTQRQGDNRVDVDGDDNDFLALAIPNLVAANCAGQSYSLGAGGAGFGFGLGQAQIDENCQIAKAIATAHLLQKTGLVSLESIEYRRALCQMRGMEHVCKVKPPACASGVRQNSYPGWCGYRVARDKKPSQWSQRDLSACGLRRASFERDIANWDANYICKPPPDPTPPTPPIAVDPVPPPYVMVRTGRHCGYDRVVFDWPNPVKYEVKSWEDKVVVDFDRNDEIDVSRVSKSLGRFILGASSEEYASGTRVTFTVGDGVKHRVWKWDHRVVVDIKKPGCPSA